MQNIKVKIHQADNDSRELPWPYSHVPRVGERFTIGEPGSKHVVTEVPYNYYDDGSGFLAVVTVDRG